MYRRVYCTHCVQYKSVRILVKTHKILQIVRRFGVPCPLYIFTLCVILFYTLLSSIYCIFNIKIKFIYYLLKTIIGEYNAQSMNPSESIDT